MTTAETADAVRLTFPGHPGLELYVLGQVPDVAPATWHDVAALGIEGVAVVDDLAGRIDAVTRPDMDPPVIALASGLTDPDAVLRREAAQLTATRRANRTHLRAV